MKWKEFLSGKSVDVTGEKIRKDEKHQSDAGLVDIDDLPKMVAAEKEARRQQADKRAADVKHRHLSRKHHLPGKLKQTKEYRYYKDSLAIEGETPLFLEVADLGKKELTMFTTWAPGHGALLILSDWGLRLVSAKKGFRAEEYPLSQLRGIYKNENHYIIQVGNKKIQMRIKKANELIKLFEQLKTRNN
ncbi:hypothetical protein ACBR55_12265 [Salinicoccus roseus]|uniref:hypothetical protein n=1 Tax=Salinicoccus roseus TaxID=45670 RepID=UPI003524BCA6